MTNPPDEGQPPQDPYPNQGQQRPEDQGYWQQQGQQQPYGQAPGYPSQYPPQGLVVYAPEHPKATTSLVLGILGVVLCQVIAPFAWSIGKKTLDEIDAANGTVGGRGSAKAGYILGIVGTVILILSVLFFVVYIIIIAVVIGGTAATSSY